MRYSLLLLALESCIPDVAVDDSLVTKPRVVAMQSTPAEAKAGAAVTWTALVVAPPTTAVPDVSWSICKARKALSESGPVSAACLDNDAAAVTSAGRGPSVTASLTTDACRLFGPDPPVAKPGEPAGRAVDPDSTGGYYQPVIMRTAVSTLGQTRLTCGVAGATQEQSADFVTRYRPNENPTVESLQLDGVALPTDGDGPTVKAGSHHTLVVSWPDCTDATAACGGAEPYIVFNPTSLQIVERREAMHVSWYTTGGSFREARGGVLEKSAGQHSLDNEWVAPDEAGAASLWVVLLDDRGGAGWQRSGVTVVP